MREDARDARRIFNYSIHGDISISFTLLRTRFSLPPPLPVERPSLLKFLLVASRVERQLNNHGGYIVYKKGARLCSSGIL